MSNTLHYEYPQVINSRGDHILISSRLVMHLRNQIDSIKNFRQTMRVCDEIPLPTCLIDTTIGIHYTH